MFRCAACSGVCSLVEASVSAGKRGCRACVNLAKLLTGRSDSRGLGPLARRRATPVPLPANESSTSPPGGQPATTHRRASSSGITAGCPSRDAAVGIVHTPPGGRARRTAQPAPPGHGGRASRGAAAARPLTGWAAAGCGIALVRVRRSRCRRISQARSPAGRPVRQASAGGDVGGAHPRGQHRGPVAARRAGSGRLGVHGARVPVGDVHPAHAARPEHAGDVIDG